LLESRFRGVISIENARSQLGWEPVFRLLREGVAEYIDEYRRFLGASATPAPIAHAL